MASSGVAPFSPGLLLPLLLVLLLLPLGSRATKKRLELVLETEDNAWMSSCVSLASNLTQAALIAYALHILYSVISLMLGNINRWREQRSLSLRVTRGQYRSSNAMVSVQLPSCAQRQPDQLDQETQQDPPSDRGPSEELVPEEPSVEGEEGPKPQEP